jgi:NADH:ubiquinone oxidoreductase subunit 2 (subunit N)
VGLLEAFSFIRGVIVIGLSALIGGVGGIGQSQLRPLFAYSSICHIR